MDPNITSAKGAPQAASKEEYKLIEQAAREFYENGEVVTACPRCGAKLIVDATDSAYEVRCENDRCLRVVFRGI